jgi:hypothetical protein
LIPALLYPAPTPGRMLLTETSIKLLAARVKSSISMNAHKTVGTITHGGLDHCISRKKGQLAGTAGVSRNAAHFLQTTAWIAFVFAAITLKRALAYVAAKIMRH